MYLYSIFERRTNMGAIIEFKNVDKYYGKYHALKNINLEIDEEKSSQLLAHLVQESPH